MMRTRLFSGLGTFVAALTLFAGMASAQTQPRPAQQPATGRAVEVAGRLTTVSANSVTLQTRAGNITANITAATWIVVDKDGKPTEGALADLKTGQPASVAGLTTATVGVIEARVVAQSKQWRQAVHRWAHVHVANDMLRRHAAVGEITAINGAAITLRNAAGGQVVVNTSPTTLVLNNGFVALSTLKPGDKVAVLGRPVRPAGATAPAPAQGSPASRTIDAWGIKVQGDSTRMVGARVQAVNSNTIAVRLLEGGAATIALDASTGYRRLTIVDGQPVISNASQADVKVGTNLLVEVSKGPETRTFTAKSVVIMPSPAQ